MRTFSSEVRWDGNVISGLAPVGPLRDTVDVITFRQDANTSLNVPGPSHTDTVRFERELCDDLALEIWARGPILRKNVELTFTDTAGGFAVSFVLRKCWVCAYAISPHPESGSVIESVTLSVGRWDRLSPAPSSRADRLAAELGTSVRRVGIATLMSKYRDETPAVLDRILAEASRKGEVLFFDEAESLFESRTDVRDSHDRYKPGRVDEVLQRLSDFKGPIVVAEQSPATEDPDGLPA